MSIKRMNDLSEKISSGFSEENHKFAEEMIDELGKNVTVAKDIILGKIAEKDLVRYMQVIQKTVVAVELNAGNLAVGAANQAGQLEGYTHSVILACIGGLINDEIL